MVETERVAEPEANSPVAVGVTVKEISPGIEMAIEGSMARVAVEPVSSAYAASGVVGKSRALASRTRVSEAPAATTRGALAEIWGRPASAHR